MTAIFDLRMLAVRTDVVDIALKDIFLAPRYAEPRPVACAAPYVPVGVSPHGEPSSELLSGERFMVLDIDGDWAWGWCEHDHYVGYVETAALGEAPPAIESMAADPVEAARRFIDMPYLLSGRGGAGIDCSGLMQRAFAATGVQLPRDSDMQRSLGEAVARNALRRGDLVGFPGHIGIMADADTLLHATGHWGRVLLEPLAQVEARTPIISMARLSADPGRREPRG